MYLIANKLHIHNPKFICLFIIIIYIFIKLIYTYIWEINILVVRPHHKNTIKFVINTQLLIKLNLNIINKSILLSQKIHNKFILIIKSFIKSHFVKNNYLIHLKNFNYLNNLDIPISSPLSKYSFNLKKYNIITFKNICILFLKQLKKKTTHHFLKLIKNSPISKY